MITLYESPNLPSIHTHTTTTTTNESIYEFNKKNWITIEPKIWEQDQE